MEFKRIIDENRETYMAELFEVLRQESISAEGRGIPECAELMAGKLKSAGIEDVEIIETEYNPVVCGEYHVSDDAKTMLIYGHYDVQPPDPLEEWVSPPFEPTIRDGRVYARGAGDNKGQIMAQILAVKTYIEAEGSLPINVKFVIEGEEETGSPNLPAFVEQHKEKLETDLVYTSDGPMLADGHPVVLLGVRGLLYVELTARGSQFDNHSGNKGNIARNPAWELMNLLSTMKDDNGRVLIEGFYDNVLPPTEKELELIDRLPFDLDDVSRNIGDDSIEFTKADYYRALCFEPTFNIAGFTSGYGGEGAKTIIPAEAKVKMDMRLVMDQDPDEIFERLRNHVEKHAPDVEVEKLGIMQPSRTSSELEFIEPIRRSAEKSFGREAFIQPSLGGSLPDAVWTKILGVPSVVVPYANIDEANHSPNENLVVEHFYKGIETTCRVISEIGELDQGYSI
ncbi:deacylase [Salinicoccus sediminis]|uniref:Deacylase n=1 Tax=Salinicoccus sediminis TaxID=1432562 RepID=A0A0M2SFA4_9STAP|nr:M20/M25/M40 family metallo-hydrolase [Salinicoccus sediminis]KKK32958.1 deacylase [Salinicoccus sediminis]